MTYQIPFSCLGVIIGLIKMASDYEPVQKKSAFWVGTNQTKASLLSCTYFHILLLANNAVAGQTAPGLSLICILIFSIWQEHVLFLFTVIMANAEHGSFSYSFGEKSPNVNFTLHLH